jgi:sugar-specific transcriptional regulator TrmB
MDQENGEIRVLIELGFNTSQAKVYLALSKIGETKAKKVAKAAKMDRAETYRVIAQLCEMGFVKRKLTYPSKFVAVPIKELLPVLIKNKKEQIAEIERKAAQLIQRFSNEKKGAKLRDEYILFVPKVEMILEEIRKDVRSVKKSDDFLTSIEDQENIGYEKGMCLAKALRKEVKIKMVIDKPSKGKSLPKHIMELAQHPNFILRYIPEPSECELVIQDNKKVWIKTTSKSYYQSPWLVSNNPQIVVLARAFFDKIFKDSTPANERKSERASSPHQFLERKLL